MDLNISNKQLKELLTQYNISDNDIKGHGKNGNVLKSDRLNMYLKLQKQSKKKSRDSKENLPKLPPEVVSLITNQLSMPTTRLINRESLKYNTPLYMNILKQFLSKNEYIVWNENILDALNDLYDNIDKLINENYDDHDIPIWVNIEQFKKSMRKKFIDLFINEFINVLSIHFKNGHPPKKSFKILLNKQFIAYPLISHNVDTDSFYDEDENGPLSEIQNEIIVTENMIDYIAPTIKVLYDKDYHLDQEYVLQTLYDLFFANK